MFKIVRCKSCGFLYLDPRADEASLGELYAELSTLALTQMPQGTSPEWGIRLQGDDVVGSTVDASPVLDVGCGSGDQMLRVAQRGFEVEGFDGDPAAIKRAVKRGLKARVADIQDAELQENHYAWLVMSHVLEHLVDPLGSLRRFRCSLRPGGRILILVPDAASPVKRLFREWWHGWDPPFHLNHFTKATLERMLREAGFHVERISSRVTSRTSRAR